MKRIKLAVCAAALMAMMGFSSCLNGDVNTTQQLSLILKAETDYLGIETYFVDAYGIKYKPVSTTLINKESDFAVVPMQFDTSTFNAQTSSYDITLLGEPSFLKGLRINGEASTVPDPQTLTAALNLVDDGYTRGTVWGKNEYLILPIIFPINKDVDLSDQTELKNELSKHHFNITFDPEKMLSEDGDSLKLKLTYTVDGVDDAEEYAKTYTQTVADTRYSYMYASLNPVYGILDEDQQKKVKWIRMEFEDSKNDKPTVKPEEKNIVARSYRLYQEQ